MSATAETIQTRTATLPEQNLSLWLRQLRAIIAFDLKKNFFGKRSLLVYLLALMPIGLLTLVALANPGVDAASRLPTIYSIFYNLLILRTIVFFGCAWIFMNLFRGEIVDRSLHYYFLSAVRREVLVVGKYISGLVTSIVLFTFTTVVGMLLLYLPHFYSQSVRYFVEGKGLAQILTYA